MDSQDNIVLTTTRFESSKDIVIPVTDKINKNILFVINEYDDATLTNNSENYDVFVENLEEGGETKITYGNKVTINSNDHPNPPLEYRIRIYNKTTNKSSLYLYKIAHTSSTTDSQYKEMISAIGLYDEKLLYEDDAKYLSGKRIYNSTHRSLYALFALITTNKSGIINSLNSIYNNPLLKDKKIVVKTSSLKKQSVHSIIKNERSHHGENVYSTQMVQYSDFPLNQYFCFMLSFSKGQIDSLISDARKEKNKIKTKTEKINEIIVKKDGRISRHNEYQLNVLNRRLDILDNFHKSALEILTFINKVLLSSDFKNVLPSSKRDNTIVYHAHYLNIERKLYLPLLQGLSISFANNYSSILASPIKQTSKLFEAYCLLTLDAAITETGFEMVDEIFDYEHIIKTFVKDEYEFELLYSVDAKDVSLVKKNEFYYINKNTSHVSPDFFLILKKNEVPLCFMIFDSKCRKPEYVQKEIENGKYEETVRNYLSLRYATDDNPFFLPKIVDTLWLLFPSDYKYTDFENVNNLEYHFAKLSLNGDEDDFIEMFNEYISFFLG